MTAWTKLINEIGGFTNEIRNLPVSQHVTPTQIRSELKRWKNKLKQTAKRVYYRLWWLGPLEQPVRVWLIRYSKQIEHQADLGDHLRRRLKQAGWLIRNETSLPVVCFSHPDINDGTISTGKILEEIYARGKVWISDVVLGGKERVLRACITSFHSDQSDIDYLQRINYEGEKTPTVDTLKSIHHAQLYKIPFENFEIQLGRAINLDPEAIFEKFVQKKRQ